MTWHQIRSLSHRRRRGGTSYANQVLAFGPIAYWPLDEAGGSVARCLVNSAQNGAYTGVTLANDTGPFGTPSPYFDGANDYANIYSATLDAAFNGATGTAAMWVRVANAGVWTDGTLRYPLILKDDADNGYVFYRNPGNDRIDAVMEAGAGQAIIAKISYSNTDWFLLAQTWSDANNDDEAKYFVDGMQAGSTSAALNAWSGGGLLPSATVIGAGNTTPTGAWHGWIGQVMLFDYVLPPATLLGLANP